MSTVIDELVVQIDLQSTVGKDISKESASVQKELDDLREKAKGSGEAFEKAFAKLSPTAKKVWAVGKAEAAKYWGQTQRNREALEKQGKKAIKTQVDLGNVSRRTGASIAAGTRTGTEGLSALATAGLTAYAAIEAVHSIMGKVKNAAAAGIQTGQAAYLAGVPVQWMGAYEQYVRQTSGTPFEATEGAVGGLAQKLELYKNKGVWDESFTGFGRWAEIGDLRQYNVQSLIEKLTGIVGKEGKNGPLAQFLGSEFDLSPLTLTMAKGTGSYNRGIAENRATAPTDKQVADLSDLRREIYKAEDAWNSLTRVMIDDNPAWLTAIDTWKDFLLKIQSTPQGLATVQAAADAVSVAIGVTLVAAIWKLSKSVLAANAEMLASPLGRLLLIGAVAAYGLSPSDPGTKDLNEAKTPEDQDKVIKQKWKENTELQREIDEFRKENNIGWGANAMRNLMGGYVGYEPFEAWRKKKGYDTANPLPMIYGKPGQDGNTASGMPSAGPPSDWNAPQYTPGNTSQSDPRGVGAALQASAVRYGFNPDDIMKIAHEEGIGAPAYGTWDVNGMSYGALQAHTGPTGGMAEVFQKATGLNPADPKNEIAMNDWLLQWASQNGWGPWTSVSRGIVRNPRRLTTDDLPKYVDALGATDTSNVVPFPKAKPDDNSWYTQQIRNSRAVQAINAGGPSGQVSNSQTSQVNVGSVNISTPSADPASHGAIVSDTIRSSMLASNVNSGLE